MLWPRVRKAASRVVTWLRRYWKWLLFPVGLALALVGFVAGSRSKPGSGPIPGPNGGDVDQGWTSGGDAVDAVLDADRRRDEALAALKKENEARLQNLSQAQRAELEALREKPIEEVASWFDKL